MTTETLKRANDLTNKIDRLKETRRAFNKSWDKYPSTAEIHIYGDAYKFGAVTNGEVIKNIAITAYRDALDKDIAELERQLEEL
jgi:hypothetical protein